MRSESGFDARQFLRDASLELARLRRIRGAYRTTWRRIACAQARLTFAAALLAASLAEPAAAGTPNFRHGLILDAGEFYRSSPTFADIDGDGDLDVFVGEALYNSTIFFENTGTATAPGLAAPSTNPFGLANVAFGARPAFVDIDADGDLDAFSNDGIFFENTGSASAPAFAPPSTGPFGLASLGPEPEFADIDGDGDLDAFAGSGSGDTIFLANTGTASAPAFGAPSTNPFGLADVGSPALPDLVDIDDDGDLDAFVGSTGIVGGRLFFFENTGTTSVPAFAAPAADPFGLFTDFRSLLRETSPAFADVDGDGDFDALVGSYYFTLLAFENTGTASTPAFTFAGNPFGLGGLGRSPPTFADIDGDGDLDAFVGDRYGRTLFFANTGTASGPSFTFLSTNAFGLADVGLYASPELVDIDGDGDLDAFVGERGGSTFFFANTGTLSVPAFASPSANPFGLADVGADASPELVDIDGDGDLDAFVGERYGGTLFFANTGTASAPAFAAPSTNPFGLADVGFFASPDFADVDGDGDLDAFVGESGGRTIVFLNTGTAGAPAFATPSTNPFGLADVGVRASPSFADIDADGDLDAFVGEDIGRIFFFENVVIDPEACTDGLDNDSDGQIDLGTDPGCAGAADTSELSSRQCDNGLDDDGDGAIDWRGDGSGDPECFGLRDTREARTPPEGCGIGPELLLLAPLLAWARRRSA